MVGQGTSILVAILNITYLQLAMFILNKENNKYDLNKNEETIENKCLDKKEKKSESDDLDVDYSNLLEEEVQNNNIDLKGQNIQKDFNVKTNQSIMEEKIEKFEIKEEVIEIHKGVSL